MLSPIETYLQNLHQEVLQIRSGEVADYIPELTRVDADAFGICLVTVDGKAYCAGDTDALFTIQSISKAFVYATALADRGRELVMQKIGVEPSGEAFNSISLDPVTHAPFNPMINAGAIAATSLVAGADSEEQWARIQESMAAFAGRALELDDAVYRSESSTGFRNRAIAWMLKNFGIVDGDAMEGLENYFRQCSLKVSCQDIAMMAATLANGGVHPVTGKAAVPSEHVERVLSVMATCGMYDYAGSWLSEVGMPAKSGVGGGIVAALPGRFGIAVYSPRLDAKGNSVRGIEVCKRISRDFHLNLFTRGHDPGTALGRIFTGTDAPSRRQRQAATQAKLEPLAPRIKCFSLHGYLAVDGVEHVIRRMEALESESNCFILDMQRVDGLSESGARLLSQARVALWERGIAVVFSRIHQRRAIALPLRRAVVRGDTGYLGFEDNDLAMEWCENHLLGDAALEETAATGLQDARLFAGLPAALLQELERVAMTARHAKGEKILASGQAGDGRIFFIVSGQVSVLVPLSNGAHQRIATLAPGMVFGEMVLLGQTTRSASVFADSDVECKVLEARDLDDISSRDPRLKLTLLENLGRDLAGRLRASTQWISALG